MVKINHIDATTLTPATISQRKAEIEYVLTHLDESNMSDLPISRQKIEDLPDLFNLFEADKFISGRSSELILQWFDYLVDLYKANKLFKVENKGMSFNFIKSDSAQSPSPTLQTIEMKKPPNYLLEGYSVHPMLAWGYEGDSAICDYEISVSESVDSVVFTVTVDVSEFYKQESFCRLDLEFEVLWRIIP